MNLYRDILKTSFYLTIKNKFLWLFSFFVIFLGNSEYSLIFNQSDNGINFKTLCGVINFFSLKNLSNIPLTFKSNPLAFTRVILLAILLFFILITLLFLIIISQGALIKAIDLLSKKKKITISQAVNKSWEKFWQLIGINLIDKLVIFSFFILLSIALVYKFDSPLLLVLFILGFVIIISLAVTLSFVFKLAVIDLVAGDNNFVNSIINGFNLFKENWLSVIELDLILLIINLLVGLFFSLVALLLSTPFVILIFLGIVLKSVSFLMFSLILAGLFIFVIISFTALILTNFQYSCWVIFYQSLKKKNGIKSKILRLAKNYTYLANNK